MLCFNFPCECRVVTLDLWIYSSIIASRNKDYKSLIKGITGNVVINMTKSLHD